MLSDAHDFESAPPPPPCVLHYKCHPDPAAASRSRNKDQLNISCVPLYNVRVSIVAPSTIFRADFRKKENETLSSL